jgi:phosphoribosyl 1,2-cyclic phosphodiesterase
MRVIPLGSGSGGNSYFFEGDGSRLLIDAGFSARETRKRLESIGESIESLEGIVITHEHSDHIHGAARIAGKYGIPIHLTRGTLNAAGFDPAEVPLRVFENNSTFRVGQLQVHARRTIHDAADPACFVVEAADGTRAGLASDLGHADEAVINHLSGCDILLFEANHDLDLLREGSYPWSLKRRIMSRVGHLSNDEALAAVERMIGPELQSLCLIHLSAKNNHESIVRSMTGGLLRRLGIEPQLEIARQEQPSTRLEVSRRAAPPAQPGRQLALF